jgi:hypothetical protein
MWQLGWCDRPIIEIGISGHHLVAGIPASIFADLSPASLGPFPISIGRLSSKKYHPFFKNLARDIWVRIFPEKLYLQKKSGEFFLIMIGQVSMYF